MSIRTSLPTIAALLSLTLGAAGASAQTAKVAGDPPDPEPQQATAVEVGIYGYGASISIDNSLHAIGGDMPDPLKHRHLRMTGIGAMPGAEMRLAVMPRLDPFGRLRLGLDIGAGGLTGLGTSSLPLPEGVSYKPGSAWAAHFDGFVGREFAIGRRADVLAPGRHAWLYPYVDVMAGATITQAKLDLHVAKLGFVGTTTVNAYSFDLGPRAGLAIPLGQSISFDFGGFGNLLGVERFGGYAGFSIVAP